MTPLPAIKRSQLPFYFCVAGLIFTILLTSTLGPVERHPLLFNPSYVLSFIFLFGMFKTFPVHWSDKHQWIFIGSLAALVRMAFFPYPASNDVNRYIWEGYILNKGFNPYLLAPDSPVLKPYVIDIWHEISHKDLTACYPPLAMLLFRMAAAVSPTISCFKGLILAFDLGSIWILSLLLRIRGLAPHRIILYALNPLVLVFIAGEGHLDVIQIFFILLSLYLLTRNQKSLAFFSLGCGVMVKYFAILIAPFLIDAKNWKNSLYLIAAMTLFYLPFSRTGTDLFSSLLFFGAANTYNDSIAILLRMVLGPYAVFGSLVLLGLCLAVIFVIVHEPIRSSYLVLGSSLLLLATLNPWYLVLITPFLAFFPSRAWLYLQLAVVPALYLQYHTASFYRSYWITLLEYLPFYGLIIWDTYHKRQMLVQHRFAPVRRLSAVVPVLNEAQNIRACIEALQKEKAILEIIVVDGGSIDGTQEIAKSFGVKVITTAKGRGRQIRVGIEHCQGDVIVIVHGDCIVREKAVSRIILELNSRLECIGGALAMQYLDSSIASHFTAWLNNARSRWTGVSFGDQAQFFRKQALPLIGGYPDLMLMEDVELSMRLKEAAPLCFIPKGIKVSKRRWERTGFWSNSFRVVQICFRYLVQRRLRLLDSTGQDFYRLYYRRDNK